MGTVPRWHTVPIWDIYPLRHGVDKALPGLLG